MMKCILPFSSLLFSYLHLSSAQQTQQAVLSDSTLKRPTKNVAIIGAGAAGSSAAYHLHKYAEQAGIPLNLTILERNPYIGGRSTTVNVYDDPSQPVELGASIFVQVNRILVDAVQEFALSTDSFVPADEEPHKGPGLGIWDGRRFVLQLNDETAWWDYAKLFWRYGLAPLRTRNLMKSTVGRFLKMYGEPVFPFASLTQAVQDTGLLAATSSTGEQFMRENSVGNMQFGREVVQASTRVNYAQNLKYIHGLEAMVCMATDGAMSVLGGNWQIFHNMVASVNGNVLIETEVEAIESNPKAGYTIKARKANSDVAEAEYINLASFDDVVLAAPYQFANLSLPKDLQWTPDSIPYVDLHVTLFASPHPLNPRFFGGPIDMDVPRVILTTISEDEEPRSGAEGVGSPGFFSISLLRTVNNPNTHRREYLYKIFSAESPNITFFSSLLGLQDPSPDLKLAKEDVSWMYRKIWQSYPYELPRVTFEEINLDRRSNNDGHEGYGGLWYSSGIESFISTMETSALMGKNVARLIADSWEASYEQLVHSGCLTAECEDVKTSQR